MGAEMSTMGSMLSSYMEEAWTRQTMLGVILATPIFINYFMTIRDYYLNRKCTAGQTHSSIDSGFCIDENLTLLGAPPMLVSTDNELGCEDVSTDQRPLPGYEEMSSEQVPLMADSRKKTSVAPCSTTSDFLLTLSKRLIKKSKTEDHSGKIGISEVLYQLAEILFKDEKYKESNHLLEKSERLQKEIIDETIVCVASAMYKQGNYYNEHGNAALGKIYLDAAMELRQDASPATLGKAWAVHIAHKPKHCKDPALKEHVKKVERRLKRASAEAKPLVKILKLKASCVRNQHLAGQ